MIVLQSLTNLQSFDAAQIFEFLSSPFATMIFNLHCRIVVAICVRLVVALVLLQLHHHAGKLAGFPF